MNLNNHKKNERNLLFILAGFILIGFFVVNSLSVISSYYGPKSLQLQPGEGPTQALQRSGIPEEDWGKYYVKSIEKDGSARYVQITRTELYDPTNLAEGTQIYSGQSAQKEFFGSDFSSIGSTDSGILARNPPVTQNPTGNAESLTNYPEGPFVDTPAERGEFADSPAGSQYDPPVNPEDIASGKTGGEVQNVDGIWAGMGKGFLGNIAEGALWAGYVYTGVQLLGQITGTDQALTDALSEAGALGMLGGKAVYGGVQQWGNPAYASTAGISAGVAIGVLYFAENYKQTDQKTVEFKCRPWQPPRGGENCELCNEGDFPCSEYQCRALGQSCELVNKGTGEERCVYSNRNDVNPPVIQPNSNVLNEGFSYTPDDSVSPPDRGVQIIDDNSENGCIPAFTPLKFGVTLDEPATCKVDDERKETYEEMQLFASDGLSRYNHTFSLSLPGPSSSENITIQNDGQFSAYVRCKDANDNANIGNFVFNYCVQEGPDTTPPRIVATSMGGDSLPIAYNQSSVENFLLYVNEPSECSWSHNNRDYDLMENEMSCSTSVTEYNAQSLYTCEDTINGLKDRVENDIYFRCRDQPNAPESERNTNAESKKITLIGTQPLVIDSVSPNGTTVSDATDSVKVTIKARTSAGYREGEATCRISETGEEESYADFLNTGGTHEHSQDLFLPEGQYVYFIRCSDAGGNVDEEEIEFSVDSDNEAPSVVRAYKEENFLKLVTDEAGECVYGTTSCNYLFEDGTPMNTQNEINHFTEWDKQSNIYVKCKDGYGNQPNPDQCSITIRTTKF